MADSRGRNAVSYNEDCYVPPSDDEDSGNDDYEISLPDSNASDGYLEDADMEVNVSTSELVTGANNVLYHDLHTNYAPNPALDISTHQNSALDTCTEQNPALDVSTQPNPALDISTQLSPNPPPHPSTEQNPASHISPEPLSPEDYPDSPPQNNELDLDADPDDDADADGSDNYDDNDNDVLGIQIDIPADPSLLQFTPIETFANDMEDPDDFANGWEWITQQDPGPATEEFTGFPGLVIPPNDRTPPSFFKLFFDEPMFAHIADETNRYAQKKVQGKNN